MLFHDLADQVGRSIGFRCLSSYFGELYLSIGPREYVEPVMNFLITERSRNRARSCVKWLQTQLGRTTTGHAVGGLTH